MTSQEIDPHRSPVKMSGSTDSSIVTESADRRRFRWRVIPVTLLYIYGGCLLASGLMGIVFVFFGVFISSRGHIFSGQRGEQFPIIVSPGMAVLGCLFLYMGRNCWQGHWRRVAIAALPASAMIGLGILIGWLVSVFK